MNSLPLPAIAAAATAVVALPFSVAAAGTLLLTAGLGAVIHVDYVQRQRRIRLPRLNTTQPTAEAQPCFCAEVHQLAA
jgi:hypothetical protein